jgi:pilus assembly protein TadC
VSTWQTGWPLVAAACAGVAALLALPSPVRVPTVATEAVAPAGPRRPPLAKGVVVPVLAGAGAWVVVGGAVGVAAGAAVALVARRVLLAAEPGDVRRARRQAARDLPALVELLAATLRSGASPGDGLGIVCDALPGPVADRLAGVRAGLALGVAPAEAWTALAGDPVLAPLGRALARAETTGASVVTTVERLADELEERELAVAEDRARAVGVRAAVPLGLCLLPAFIVLGIVPTVAGLLGSLLP